VYSKESGCGEATGNPANPRYPLPGGKVWRSSPYHSRAPAEQVGAFYRHEIESETRLPMKEEIVP
jgi:hypothetical protein